MLLKIHVTFVTLRAKSITKLAGMTQRLMLVMTITNLQTYVTSLRWQLGCNYGAVHLEAA
jgi:hypothetical protein